MDVRFDLTRSDVELLDEFAVQQGLSRDQVLRQAIRVLADEIDQNGTYFLPRENI